jgi:predicted GNAT family N-acyltransferase
VLVPGKNPIVFQVEQACAYSSNEERAVRVQIKKILGESEFEVLLDLILSEPTLFTQPVVKFGRVSD